MEIYKNCKFAPKYTGSIYKKHLTRVSKIKTQTKQQEKPQNPENP